MNTRVGYIFGNKSSYKIDLCSFVYLFFFFFFVFTTFCYKIIILRILLLFATIIEQYNSDLQTTSLMGPGQRQYVLQETRINTLGFPWDKAIVADLSDVYPHQLWEQIQKQIPSFLLQGTSP
jgi:hypothetical protein